VVLCITVYLQQLRIQLEPLAYHNTFSTPSRSYLTVLFDTHGSILKLKQEDQKVRVQVVLTAFRLPASKYSDHSSVFISLFTVYSRGILKSGPSRRSASRLILLGRLYFSVSGRVQTWTLN
jgi:hypothetical protein